MSTRRARRVLPLLCWTRSRALAQNENETMGFQSNHQFDGGTFGENIDILNGGLSLTTPIGPRFQLNQNLGYQLQVYYNSKIWDKGESDHKAGLFRRGPMGLGNVLHFGRIYRDVAYAYFPSESSGGTPQLKFDRVCTWIYVSSDGNEHVLTGAQHRPDQASLAYQHYPQFGYTVDGTFYNFGVISGSLVNWSGTGTPPTLQITTADGLLCTFGHFIQITNSGGEPFNAGILVNADQTSLDYRLYNRDYGGTPNNNTVKFNDVQATPFTVGSSTQITARVPTGAPTISSFSPTIGAPGTALTVTGTNFVPSRANDKLKVNLTAAPVPSATPRASR